MVALTCVQLPSPLVPWFTPNVVSLTLLSPSCRTTSSQYASTFFRFCSAWTRWLQPLRALSSFIWAMSLRTAALEACAVSKGKRASAQGGTYVRRCKHKQIEGNAQGNDKITHDCIIVTRHGCLPGPLQLRQAILCPGHLGGQSAQWHSSLRLPRYCQYLRPSFSAHQQIQSSLRSLRGHTRPEHSQSVFEGPAHATVWRLARHQARALFVAV